MAASVDGVPWPTAPEQLDLQQRLGNGFFGEVYRATVVGDATARLLAVKKVKLSIIIENRLTEQLQREIKIMYSLQHPRIIRLFFDFQDSKFMYLGMEFARGGTLFDKLSGSGKFVPETCSRYFMETCEALDYLHHLPEKVIHRDIKPENILLDAEDHVKLADFGWANQLQAGKRDTFCGTLDYLPPEMIMGTGHDESVDMWNMGVLLYELSTGKSPFGSSSKETTCRMIINVDLRFPADLDLDARDLIASLCKKKGAERLKVREALAHRFVTKFSATPVPVAGDPSTAEVDASRPSVVVRGLRAEREKISAEMEHLLKAKQTTEDELMRVTEDLESVHSAIQEQKKGRAQLEAGCAELERGCNARDAELAELRKRVEALQAEVTKLGKPGWWGKKR